MLFLGLKVLGCLAGVLLVLAVAGSLLLMSLNSVEVEGEEIETLVNVLPYIFVAVVLAVFVAQVVEGVEGVDEDNSVVRALANTVPVVLGALVLIGVIALMGRAGK